MSNPFTLWQETDDHIDYEAALELPALPNGQECSVVVRLTLNKSSNEAYTSVTYETEGAHMRISDDSFPEDTFRSIVGMEPTRERKLEIQKAELLEALQDCLALIVNGPEGSQDYQERVESQARAAIAKATTNS